jgi:hypothetical protein
MQLSKLDGYCGKKQVINPSYEPEVTLFITAYNEKRIM